MHHAIFILTSVALIITHKTGSASNILRAEENGGVGPGDRAVRQDIGTRCDQISETTYRCGERVYRNVTWKHEGVQTVRASVTMYTSREQETDASPCIAANGKDICKLLAQGVQTCASNDYKLGTKLRIEKLGECTVMDRMAKRFTGTGRVDFYAGYDLKRALKHGVKTLAVTILK